MSSLSVDRWRLGASRRQAQAMRPSGRKQPPRIDAVFMGCIALVWLTSSAVAVLAEGHPPATVSQWAILPINLALLVASIWAYQMFFLPKKGEIRTIRKRALFIAAAQAMAALDLLLAGIYSAHWPLIILSTLGLFGTAGYAAVVRFTEHSWGTLGGVKHRVKPSLLDEERCRLSV
jgi:hypothetical protein